MKMCNIISIIPARGGSKGIPGKNVRLLSEYPLIAYSIAAAKMSKRIERIIVSTDSQEIAEISLKYGAEVPFIRPSEFAQDKSTDLDFMLHALKWFQENEKYLPEYWVHLRPTTPFRIPSIIDDAIDAIIRTQESTSLRSAHRASESPFKWFKKSTSGYFEPFKDNLTTDQANDPRQAFVDAYIPDGYVDVLKASFILENKILHGNKMIGFVSPTCTEVDSFDDFEYLEYEIKKKGCNLLDYLQSNFLNEN
jgi:N-acylneuraminate cytidylyltransferase